LLPLPTSFFKAFRFHKNLTASNFFLQSLPLPYEKCFRFQLLKKSNASKFASSFFLQSASASLINLFSFANHVILALIVSYFTVYDDEAYTILIKYLIIVDE